MAASCFEAVEKTPQSSELPDDLLDKRVRLSDCANVHCGAFHMPCQQFLMLLCLASDLTDRVLVIRGSYSKEYSSSPFSDSI